MSVRFHPPGGDDDNSGDFDESAVLIAGQVLGNLSDSETQRLRDLSIPPDHAERQRESLVRVADSIGLASELLHRGAAPFGGGVEMPLDADLVEKIRRDALPHLPTSPVLASPQNRPRIATGNWIGWTGWCVAASLAVACFGLWADGNRGGSDAVENVVTQKSDRGPLNDELFERKFRDSKSVGPAEAAAWLAVHPAALRLGWKINDPTNVTATETDSSQNGSVEADSDLGDVVWDLRSQSGYMRLTALPVNNAAIEQYQLWIIDPKRDDEPIDGGVFDVVKSGESYVPIRAKLAVIEPTGFAVTIEKPGGVVVSDQSRLPLLAMVSQ